MPDKNKNKNLHAGQVIFVYISVCILVYVYNIMFSPATSCWYYARALARTHKTRGGGGRYSSSSSSYSTPNWRRPTKTNGRHLWKRIVSLFSCFARDKRTRFNIFSTTTCNVVSARPSRSHYSSVASARTRVDFGRRRWRLRPRRIVSVKWSVFAADTAMDYHRLCQRFGLDSVPSPNGRFTINELVGEGTYGEVFKAKDNVTGE